MGETTSSTTSPPFCLPEERNFSVTKKPSSPFSSIELGFVVLWLPRGKITISKELSRMSHFWKVGLRRFWERLVSKALPKQASTIGLKVLFLHRCVILYLKHCFNSKFRERWLSSILYRWRSVQLSTALGNWIRRQAFCWWLSRI